MLPEQPLTMLLESYVFDVSARIISRASSQNQTILINLLNTISSFSSDSTRHTAPVTNGMGSAFLESPLDDLQQQWQEALARPVVKKGGPDEAAKESIHKAIASNQRQIETTLLHIRTMGSLIARARVSANMTPLQARLISHYRSVQDYYHAYLVQLNAFQERKLSLLSQ